MLSKIPTESNSVGDTSTPASASAVANNAQKAAIRGLLIVLGMVFAISTFDRGIMPVARGSLPGALAISNPYYSLLVSGFLAAYTLMYLGVGGVVSRLGIRRGLAASLTTMSLAVSLIGLSPARDAFLPAVVVLGFAQALVVPTIALGIFTWLPAGRHASAYSIVNAIQSTAGIVCPSLVAFAILSFGWRWAFLLPAAAGGVLLFIWLAACPDDSAGNAFPKSALSGASFSGLLSLQPVRLLIAARLISDPLWFFLQNWQVPFLEERLGMSLQTVGRVMWMSPAASMIAVFAFGAYSDRLVAAGLTVPHARVRPMAWASLLALPLFCLPLVTSPLAALILTSFACAMCNVWMSLSTILIGSLVSAEHRAGAIGLMSAVGCISAVAFNALAGHVIDKFGYDILFVAGGCLHPAAACLLLWGLQRVLSPRAPQ